LACEADARQTLAAFEQGLQAAFLAISTVGATPRYDQRGRPGNGVPPDRVGGLPDRRRPGFLPRTPRQALIDRHSCFLLSTNALEATQLTLQELLKGYKGQVQSERGFLLMKDPSFLAMSFYLNKPARIMTLFMVMTVCSLVYAALEYRIRQALKAHEATSPDQKGQQIRNPSYSKMTGLVMGRREKACQLRHSQGYLIANAHRLSYRPGGPDDALDLSAASCVAVPARTETLLSPQAPPRVQLAVGVASPVGQLCQRLCQTPHLG
jgi:hypothetical protein